MRQHQRDRSVVASVNVRWQYITTKGGFAYWRMALCHSTASRTQEPLYRILAFTANGKEFYTWHWLHRPWLMQTLNYNGPRPHNECTIRGEETPEISSMWYRIVIGNCVHHYLLERKIDTSSVKIEYIFTANLLQSSLYPSGVFFTTVHTLLIVVIPMLLPYCNSFLLALRYSLLASFCFPLSLDGRGFSSQFYSLGALVWHSVEPEYSNLVPSCFRSFDFRAYPIEPTPPIRSNPR